MLFWLILMAIYFTNCYINSLSFQKTKMDIFGFQTQGINYEKFRPEYPSELCSDALQRLESKERYLDIAVGTGKILLRFCNDFKETKGIDISDMMLGVVKEKIQHLSKNQQMNSINLQKTDVMNLNDNQKFNLITIGQALHFFPVEQALEKMKRMLAPNGMVMIFGYVLKQAKSQNPLENALFYEFYDQMLPYFTFDMYELHRHYKDQKKYPFEKVFKRVDRKNHDLVVEMTKDQYICYLKTWSAYNLYVEKFGVDPIANLASKCAQKVTCVFDYFRVRCYEE